MVPAANNSTRKAHGTENRRFCVVCPSFVGDVLNDSKFYHKLIYTLCFPSPPPLAVALCGGKVFRQGKAQKNKQMID